VNEVGIDTETGKVVVRVDPKYFRPAEVEYVFIAFVIPVELS
jgi:GDPmannose 4,6-dehydratase